MTTAPVLLYHRLKSGGYELTHEWWVEHPLLAGCAARAKSGLVELSDSGRLTVRANYKSDGMSGLGAIDDTRDTFAASFAHDALYELIREGHLFPWREWKRRADQVFEDICEQRGMSWLRRRFLRAMLWAFGAGSCMPGPEIEDRELSA